MDWGIRAGDTDKTIYVRLRDSTTGLAKTGLAFNSAGAVASYTLPLAARAAITLATQTVTGAHADGGFVEVDATNCKGLYRLDLPDAAIASGAFTVISIEFDGTIEESVMIELGMPRVNVAQWLGTAAATPTTAGVPEVDVTHWLGTAAATPSVAGVPEVDVTHSAGTAVDLFDKLLAYFQLATRTDGGIATDRAAELAELNADEGSGAGTFDNTAAVSVNTTQLAGQTVTAAAGVTFPSSVASPTNITAGTITTVTNLTNAPTAGDLTAAMKASVGDAVWDEVLSGHLTAGTTGNALNAAGSAGDPWSTALPGAYGAGTAGKIVGDNLNATVSSRSSHSAADVWSSVTRTLTAGTNIVLPANGLSGVTAWTVDITGSLSGSVGSVTGAVGSVAGNVGGNVTGSVASVTGAVGSVTGAVTVGTNNDKTGYGLAPSGLDAVLVESGITAGATLTDDAGAQLTSINARQALAITISSLGAVLAGAATTNVTIKPAGKAAGNTRVDAVVDSSGNRTAVTLKVPT